MRALKREPEAFDGDLALYERIQAERSRRLAGVNLSLQIEDTARETNPLVSVVGSALVGMGLGAKQAACVSGSYRLVIQSQFTWFTQRLNSYPAVRFSMTGVLRECEGDKPLGRVVIDDEDFIGAAGSERQGALDCDPKWPRPCPLSYHGSDPPAGASS